MAPDGFAIVLVQGLSWRTDNEMKSRRVCHARLSFEQDSVKNAKYAGYWYYSRLCYRAPKGRE
jgi:hypothetical protein